MTDPPIAPRLESRNGSRERPPAPSEGRDVVEGLERLRAAVHQWLDRIEHLAKTQPATHSHDDLDRRTREIEQQWTQLQAEADRRERQWQAQLEELDRDRRRLAEAWECLERERVESHGAARAASHASSASAPEPTVRRASPMDSTEGPVARAVLRQFEALQRDVRRRVDATPSD